MSRVGVATRLGFREQARRPLLIVLLVGLPFFFITRAIAQTEEIPRAVGLPGGTSVLTTMRDIHGADMAAITIAFLAGLALNRAARECRAKHELEFLGNTLFIPMFFITVGFLIDPRAFAVRLGLTLEYVDRDAQAMGTQAQMRARYEPDLPCAHARAAGDGARAQDTHGAARLRPRLAEGRRGARGTEGRRSASRS